MPKKKKKKIVFESDTQKIHNFHKRWNIDLTEDQKWQDFKDRVLNAYAAHIGRHIFMRENAENEFFKLIGRHLRTVRNYFEANIVFDETLMKSSAYNYLLDEADSKKFVFGVQVIFWMDTLDWNMTYDFLEDIKEAVAISGVPLEIVDTNEDVLFYPAGAKLLDEKLVNDNLIWLGSHPNSYQLFKDALLAIGIKGKERYVVDNLRLSLELLLKAVLSNNKSLENQKSELGLFFKGKSTSTEISNLYMQVLDYFNKYQNDKAKHANIVRKDEVEFILYLTGNLMRFLLSRN